jgi:uncharacterized protein YbaP (TraB family)
MVQAVVRLCYMQLSKEFMEDIQKRLILYMLFFLLLSCQLLQAQEISDALLWKISGKKLEKPSYLYGTLHALCREDMVISEEMLLAMDNSRRLALEIDITDTGLNAKMQKGMLMKGNTKLSQLLPAKDYQLLAAYFADSLGVNLASLQQMKPIFLSTLIYNRLLGCPPQSYESQLSRMAGIQRMEISGLESVEEQLKVFEHIDYREQAEMLLQTIIEYPALEEAYWNMIVSYKNQDLGSLFHVISDIQLGMKKYEEVMLNQRNQRWIPRMEQMASDSPTFFAVGAAHLPGDQGLIALLKRRGYTVEPVL